MLTNDERELLQKTEEDLKRMLRRINRILIIDATSNPEEKRVIHRNGEATITEYLIELGVPMSINGFRYLRCGIQFLLEVQGRKVLITKELYPWIAKKYGVTSQKVERSIRTAIEKAAENGNEEFTKLLNGSSQKRLTNSEFLAMVTEKIKLDL